MGLFSLLVLVATGSFGYVRDFDTGGPLGPWTEWVVASRGGLDVALAFAAFRAFGMSDRARARPDLVLLAVLVILQFGEGLLHGSKVQYILPRLLVVVFIYALFHHRMPIKWVLVFVIATALSVPVTEQFRVISSQSSAERNAAALVVGAASETVQDIDGSTAMALDTLNRRARQIENVAVILRDTPSVFSHTNGNALPNALAIALVPRVLWADKPIFDGGRSFPQLYLKQATNSRSNTGPSHIGDLYRNFGLVGVILGMGLFGAIFAALGRLTDRGGVRTLFIVAFTVAALTRVEDSLAEGIVAFARIMPPVFLAALLIPRRDP
ncbi:MAG: O-antigen polymerase [Actinomycetota bacterium]